MVIKTDRTTKLLLLIVAALLAALVLRPLWPTNQAIAADANPTPRPERPTGFRLTEVGVINIPENLTVREMQVVDSAQALVVRLNDRISVYRVDRYFLPINTITR